MPTRVLKCLLRVVWPRRWKEITAGKSEERQGFQSGRSSAYSESQPNRIHSHVENLTLRCQPAWKLLSCMSSCMPPCISPCKVWHTPKSHPQKPPTALQMSRSWWQHSPPAGNVRCLQWPPKESIWTSPFIGHVDWGVRRGATLMHEN